MYKTKLKSWKASENISWRLATRASLDFAWFVQEADFLIIWDETILFSIGSVNHPPYSRTRNKRGSWTPLWKSSYRPSTRPTNDKQQLLTTPHDAFLNKGLLVILTLFLVKVPRIATGTRLLQNRKRNKTLRRPNLATRLFGVRVVHEAYFTPTVTGIYDPSSRTTLHSAWTSPTLWHCRKSNVICNESTIFCSLPFTASALAFQ